MVSVRTESGVLRCSNCQHCQHYHRLVGLPAFCGVCTQCAVFSVLSAVLCVGCVMCVPVPGCCLAVGDFSNVQARLSGRENNGEESGFSPATEHAQQFPTLLRNEAIGLRLGGETVRLLTT